MTRPNLKGLARDLGISELEMMRTLRGMVAKGLLYTEVDQHTGQTRWIAVKGLNLRVVDDENK